MVATTVMKTIEAVSTTPVIVTNATTVKTMIATTTKCFGLFDPGKA